MKPTLPTNYKDDILNTSVEGMRRYQMIYNSDNTVSFKDVTPYDQTGSDFGAGDINLTNKAVNQSADAEKIIDDPDTAEATTEEGYIAGVQLFNHVNDSLNIRYNSETDCIEIYYNGTWNEYQKANLQVATYDFYTLSHVVRLEDTTYCSVTITSGNIAIFGKNQTTFGCSVTCLSNPIAFTKGQTVSFNCKSISLGTGSWVRVGLYSSVPSEATNQNIPNIASKTITSTGTVTFTVPSDGNYYIGIHACGGNSSNNSVSCNLSSVVTVSK